MTSAEASTAGSYRALLRVPNAVRLVVGSLIGRLTVGVAPLAMVLSVHTATHSYAVAGFVAATFALSAAVGGPVQGRLIDRLGQTRVMLPCALVSVVGLVALYASVTMRAATVVLVACAAVAGVCNPTLSASMRAMWAYLLTSAPDLQRAYAFEAVAAELVFIIGPIIVALTTALAASRDALLLAAAFQLTGSLVFTTTKAARTWRPPVVHERHWAGALRATGMRTILLTVLLVSLGFGALDVAVAAFATAHAAPGEAGVLLAIWSVGSLVGGLLHGARTWESTAQQRFVVFLAAMLVLVAPFALAPDTLVLGVMMFLAGLTVAPWLTCCYFLTERLAPAGSVTEAFSWLSACFQGGAIGTAIAGVVIQRQGVSAGLLLPLFAVAAALFVILIRRADLTRPVS